MMAQTGPRCMTWGSMGATHGILHRTYGEARGTALPLTDSLLLPSLVP